MSTATEAIQIYADDLRIAKDLILRDGGVTRRYFYQQCYPLFKSIYDNYHTDCASVKEFISEIYLLILTPSRETGRCQLENYRGESSLATWLKTACLFHCYHSYERKNRIPVVEITKPKNDDEDDGGDRFLDNAYSTVMDSSSIDRNDLEAIMAMMSNERYREIIRLRYLERRSNEETAEALGMSMANYYNKHKLAKEQFVRALQKEAKNG